MNESAVCMQCIMLNIRVKLKYYIDLNTIKNEKHL